MRFKCSECGKKKKKQDMKIMDFKSLYNVCNKCYETEQKFKEDYEKEQKEKINTLSKELKKTLDFVKKK